MTFSFSGGTVNVSGSVTSVAGLPVPGTGQTLKYAGLHNSNTGATVLTVTAGKTFYCLGVHFFDQNDGATYDLFQLQIDAADVVSCDVPKLTSVNLSGGILFSAAAGKAIVLVHSGGAGKGHCWIWGYEQ